jgi:hypothetical protein
MDHEGVAPSTRPSISESATESLPRATEDISVIDHGGRMAE